MTGIADPRGPNYISSHSADVILSEVRPIKLQADALRSINVLLDEVLYNILNAARSLSTEKLRAGLLRVLPTSLGKDALLEAEVELRAYWDRTTPLTSDSIKGGDDQRNFHLQWAFELLRLKCEAYSTLNEADENPEAEVRLQNRMGQGGGLLPPKAALVAPASLYLTAILEALCEHILSNVARVTARDSSKTSATIQDVYVALCEDNSIYSLFRQMKVYEQIESLSKASKPRRSKSLSVGSKAAYSSNQSDLMSSKGSASPRLSSDSMGSATPPPSISVTIPNTRLSTDKTRSMKMFGKLSTDREVANGDSQRGHKKSDSFRSAEMRQAVSPVSNAKPNEDAALLQEFDNLMLSDETMKVSLTPDRLKSMDSFNKERSQRSGFMSPKSDMVDHASTARTVGRQGSRPVDFIMEDEEENSPAKSPINRSRLGAQATISTSPSLSRNHSSSVSHPPSATRAIVKKSSHTDVNGSTPPSAVTRERLPSQNADTFPSRNLKTLPALNGIDLDNAMRASVNDEIQVVNKRSPQARTPLAVSSKAQDLIDFLSEGPPDSITPDPKANVSAVSLESGKLRGSGRLQKMISKLSIGNSNDKPQSRINGDTSKKSSRQASASFSSGPIQSKPFSSNTTISNRPIPPRPPPPPISPPSSSSQDSLVDLAPHPSNLRNGPAGRRASPDTEVKPVMSITTGVGKVNGIPPSQATADHTKKVELRTVSPLAGAGAQPASPKANEARVVCEICSSKKSAVRSTLPTTEIKRTSFPSLHLARDIQRQMSNATTVEECRLLFDMFLAKSGVSIEATNDDLPYPSPAPSVLPSHNSLPDTDVENFLAELLLSSDTGTDTSSIDSVAEKAGPIDVSVTLQDPLESEGVIPTQIEKDTPSDLVAH